jgi:peroxin-3
MTTVAVAYGTYRIVTWAWNQFKGDEEDADSHHDSEQLNQSTTISFHSQPEVPAPLFKTADDGKPGAKSSRDTPRRWRLRRQRMTRCREEALKGLEGLLPSLRKVIEERTNTRDETQTLKKIRAERLKPSVDSGQSPSPEQHHQEQVLWNIIQIRLITRMVATAYAHSILFLVLTVQVNLLGGRLLEDQLNSSSGGRSQASASQASVDSAASSLMDSYQNSHRFVLLHTYDYFFEQGLISLIQTVERAVSDVLANDWNVLDRTSLHLTRERMEEKISEIRAFVADGGNTPSSSSRKTKRNLLRFLMPPSAHEETPMEDELASSILNETWDLLESPVMIDAQQDCITMTFDMMRDNHWGNLFQDGSSRFVTRPLATVVPQLKHTASSFYRQQNMPSPGGMESSTVNSYCSMMQALPTVLELSDVSFN